MFDKEFFPTPKDVLDQMGIDCWGKLCLEPSAGKGDIVDWLYANGAQCVFACELNADLRRIVAGKCDLIGSNFFDMKAEDVSHIQVVVMNPPFSLGAAHILHAWKIAPEGCEIIALCNYETIRKDYYAENKELFAKVRDYGEALSLGQCFSTAERSTDVEVGLVRLFKPKVSPGTDFEGFYLDVEEEANESGMIPYNEIRAIVNNYVAAVRCFDKVAAVGAELMQYTRTKFGSPAVAFELSGTVGFHASYMRSGAETITTKESFAKAMQLQSWQYIFNRVGIQKYVTRGVMADINKFIDSRKNYPFTMKNVYRMLEIIVGTSEQTMNRAIVEAIDNFTQHTHENRYGVEGWKTNQGHLLARKFICGWISENSSSGGTLRIRTYQSNFEPLLDLVKALCYITGKRYDEIPDIRLSSVEHDAEGNMKMYQRHTYSTPEPLGMDSFIPNKWYEWGFFRFKLYKKGTGHFMFKNEDDWAVLNRAYAKIKGAVLPEKMKP